MANIIYLNLVSRWLYLQHKKEMNKSLGYTDLEKCDDDLKNNCLMEPKNFTDSNSYGTIK